mmetsp:Transcript_10391/g.16966  ORF Transcript_10391/g.16966 Transcript_10391/m.16966 type:complete len:121 (+) Transcript_10391:81-443(+)|eukprot:CAMPEP_0184649640 /NCGR_PEP_ID=MMETSP0308-20130426/7036_1 /TAXON_ID=38269 /ORGANISM="Gloeochaete witrockiana, Strain SAG 46.84" /LENGTH=120 /DNA_ID=CAMNT_0027082519 /DNA_START=69 /DNA_END=431 /DNA_ORIENTATION=-
MAFDLNIGAYLPPLSGFFLIPLWIVFSAFTIEQFAAIAKLIINTPQPTYWPAQHLHGYLKLIFGNLSFLPKNLAKFEYNLSAVILVGILLVLLKISGELGALNANYEKTRAALEAEKKEK